MNRTAAVYILAIIAVIAGIMAVIDTLRYLQWLFSPLNFIGTPLLGAILSGIVALIWFWAASKIWNVEAQGLTFMVFVSAFYLIFDVVSWIAGTPIELLLPSIVVSALAFIVGMLPSTRDEFGTP